MDTPTEMESLRARLKPMARKDFLQLCDKAGVSASTVNKFRRGLTDDLGGTKVLALIAAMREAESTPAA